MLGSLRIRQKLAVLLAIPLTAVALVMAAFTVDRVADARAYSTTAETALAAREVGGLIQTLQQERLLALGYLLIPSLDRSAVVRESQTAVDDAARLEAQPRTAAIMARARTSLSALNAVRERVLNRSVTPIVTYYTYRAAISGVIEALGLSRPAVADADGLRELLALDALIRSNEEASSAGAIVVSRAVDPEFTSVLLRSAVEADVQHLSRFRRLVDPAQRSLVDKVLGGEAAGRLRVYIDAILVGGPRTEIDISEALSAALAYTGLRRLTQDRVARDAALAAQRDFSSATATASAVAVGAAVLFLAVAALAVTVGRSIARPLRRLGRAVGAVAELSRAELVRVADSEAFDRAPPELASVEVDSDDEIGDLAAAVNRVQSTAAMLLERQATARANVATMFANVSRRTQNLVGRQLQMIDELAQEERDPEARERLMQLQHVTTRLRRSADSLFVVSGTIDQQLNAMPARLGAVLDAALVEIEGYRRIEIVEQIPDIAVGPELAPDLRLLIAELLENATNFTPPGSPIQVTATYDRERSFAVDCTITIVDHGLGMSPARMDEENRRLIERERLDVVPTRVLGLFVVGRLARRHGLTVRLEPTPGRGVTAVVRVPARWLSPASVPSGPAGFGMVPPLAAAAIESASRSGPFPWLAERAGPAAIEATPSAGPAPALAVPVSAAPPPAPLPSRSPQATALPPLPRPSANGVRAARDPEAERAALDDYLSGVARAEIGSPSEPAAPPTARPAHILEDTPPDPTPAPTLAERHQ